jgi:HKD family nuclease
VREGLFETVVTHGMERELALSDLQSEIASVDPADQPHVIGRHLNAALARRLSAEKDPDRRLELVNQVLELVAETDETILPPTRELHAMRGPSGSGSTGRYDRRPATPLNDVALLTNSHGEPSLASELRAELTSADSVDLLCAFVMWRGVRLLERELTALREASVPFRVVTTTYIGGTEREALDRLIRDFGAEVKIQYDAARTRLHAKAWLFHRNTGFDTAYVGSSNLSSSALLDGVEWNVRLSKSATPSLMQKFRATFDSYWNDGAFESYDPDRDRDRLDDALIEASGRGSHDRVTISLSGLAVTPYSYQQEMLDAIDVERQVHDRHRNLVVAATGTGKTVIAALDYRRVCEAVDASPSLLFVAHRKEILEQSLRTYREVLADPASASFTSEGPDPSGGDMCSPACSR